MTRTCSYCGETSPAALDHCPSCGRSFATGYVEHVMTPPRGTDAPEGAADALYTKLALRAVDLSDTFNAVFAQPLPGWRVEMGRPGMSTEGGKQALQHIGLRGSDGGTLVVGSVDQSASQVEIRGWRRVDAMFRDRYGRPLPIRAADWDRFAERVAEFFREEGFTVRIDVRMPGRDRRDEDDAAPRGLPFLWVLVAVVGVALLTGVITWFLLTRPAAQPLPPAQWAVPAPGTPLRP